jgi:hypothetical protein
VPRGVRKPSAYQEDVAALHAILRKPDGWYRNRSSPLWHQVADEDLSHDRFRTRPEREKPDIVSVVFESLREWEIESFFGTATSPSSACSSPTIIRKSVVFPDPFRPTSPARSPGLSWNEASTKRTYRPYCLVTRLNEIMGGGRYRTRAFRRAERSVPRDGDATIAETSGRTGERR